MDIGNLKDLKAPVIPDANRAPGYPIFLMPFVSGLPNLKIINNILYFQAFLSSLTLFFGFLYFRKLLQVYLAWLAALLLTLSPHLIIANSYILTETLLCFVMTLLFWFMCSFFTNPTKLLAFMIGIIIGLINLTRPSIQFFLFFIIIFFLIHYEKKKTILFSLLLCLGFLITVSPWIIRNKISLSGNDRNERLILFLAHGMYPDFTYEKHPESYGFPYRFDPNFMKIGESTSSIIKEIIRRFEKEPLRHLKWFVLKKPFMLFSWNIVQGMGDAFVYPVAYSPYFDRTPFKLSHNFMHSIHNIIVALGFLGCALAWLPVSKVGLNTSVIIIPRFTAIFILYFLIIHTIGTPLPRYSIPLRPFIYGMSVFPFHLLIVFTRNLKKNHLNNIRK
ncbi:hypothetical protein ACFL7M_11205 [Thermodesulfobacteriota bacterium]